jgi:hypothetical protein
VITDYASLQTAVANWLQDTTLTARIPEFIQLAEARFRRKLDDLDQDVTATLTFTAGHGPLPADFGALKGIDGDFRENPIDYDLVSGEILTDPAITGDAQIIYKRSLPALSDTITTNWLLTRAPDIYLFGALVHAEFFGWNDERLPLIKSALDEMIDELRIDSEARRWGPAPIAPVVRRT